MVFKNFLLLKEERVITPQQKENNIFIILGLPGAGKSAIQRFGLINAPNLQLLTPDKWIEILAKKEKVDIKQPEKTAELYQRVKPTHQPFVSSVLKLSARSNFIIEKLGRDLESLKKIIHLSKENGFRVVIVLVHVGLEKAKEGNRSRPRSVPEEVIEDAYKHIEKNFNALISFPEVDEAWRIDNEMRPSFEQFRSSDFIKKIK
jgi:predicted kinase